jgi:hypothetical protein
MVPLSVSPVTSVVEVVHDPGCPDQLTKKYVVAPETNESCAIKVTDFPSMTVAW